MLPSAGATHRGRGGGCRLIMFTQTVLNKEDVVHRGNDGESEGRLQEKFPGDHDHWSLVDRKQQYKEDGTDLGKRVRLPKDAWTKVAQTGDHIKNSADGENRDVTAEHQHRVLPGNHVEDGEHKKHGAQQKLIGDGIEILSEQRLLMQFAGKQSIQPITEPGQHEQSQCPAVVLLHKIDDDEGDKQHTKQRKLVGSCE
jgi:hypothetical protein